MRHRRVGFGIAMVLAVLLWAWWDGGSEPLRPIAQEIPVPEGAR